LLDEFELTSKLRTTANNLSRGMRQKLAICCAYLHDPQAILFDEPLTGLDPQGIRVFKRSLQERAAQGAAVMISSHMLAMVEDLCTHVLILDRGVERFFGPADELRRSFDDVDATASLEDIFFAATSS
jgi:ABC-2 type transport system ATP-binding protein